MNVSYYEKDNKTYIMNENDDERVVDAIDNIEEILVTENNIEDLELDLQYINEQIKLIKPEIKWFNVPKILVCIVNIVVILSLFIPSGGLANKISLCLGVAGIDALMHIMYRYIKFRSSELKDLNIDLELTLEELEKEKEKLKTLKSNSKSKNVEFSETKKLEESDLLDNLHNKQSLIKCYIDDKTNHIKHYKNNDMEALMDSYEYTAEDIEFIKFLIEEDLKNNNCKENRKGKTKKLERK